MDIDYLDDGVVIISFFYQTLWPCLVGGKVKLARKMIPGKMNPGNMIPSNFTFLCLENIKILNLYLI